jgi:chemotaxis protein CheZ
MNEPVELPDQDGSSDAPNDRILARIGQLTRIVHDSMRELGLDKNIERAAAALPDTRERLRYIATMTEQAAERVLGAVDIARPAQDQLRDDAAALDARWEQWYAASIGRDEARVLLEDTRALVRRVPETADATNAQLLEIMMAQDFQDLTGQVIRTIMDVIGLIEQQLLSLLVENIKEDQREAFAAHAAGLVTQESLLNGPQINPDGRTDVIQDQTQVDDLLASLGF